MKKLLLPTIFVAASSLNAAFTFSVQFGALYTTAVGVDAPTQITSGGGVGTGGAIGVLVVNTLDQVGFPQGAALEGKGLSFGSDWGNGYYVMSTMTAVSLTSIESTGNYAAFNGAYNTAAAGNAVALESATFGNANTAVNHSFALYWFPNITDTNPTTGLANGVTPSQATLTQGTAYGFYTNTSAPNLSVTPSNNPFITPTGTSAINGRVTQARTEDAVADATDGGIVQVGFNLDNSTFLADQLIPVVPEPSTYAILFGIIAMTIAVRKRKL